MYNLTFPCVVVIKEHQGNEKFTAFKSEAGFIDWAQKAIQNDVVCFETLESIEDVEKSFGDDRDAWPEVLQNTGFPTVYIVDENGNAKLEKIENFSEGDFWFDVLRSDLDTCIGLCSEDEANTWKKSKSLFDEMEWLGWKISD